MATSMRSGNPVLRESVFDRQGRSDQAMTVIGTTNKTLGLLALATVTALISWTGISQAGPGSGWVMAPLVGAIGGLIVGIATSFKPDWAPVTAPIYAALQGLFLGGLSGWLNLQYPGIVVQAVALTFLVFFCMLGAYKSGLIRATPAFTRAVIGATAAIALFYLAAFILSLFGWRVLTDMIWAGGWLGIGFSVFVVGLAAMNLVLDFAFIEQGEEQGAPKALEWYGAFALMVTLVWLYVEILRLLAKLNRR